MLTFSACSWTSIASFAIWSMYLVFLFSLRVFSNWISCSVFSRCSATADFSVWPWCSCLMYSWFLISMVLEVWPTYTLPYSYGMQYTPDVLRPRLSLMGIQVLEIYFIGIWIVLMLCLASSLLILLDVKCWYAIKALSK